MILDASAIVAIVRAEPEADAFSHYALARVNGMALLFKGDGFVHTDVTPAVSSR